MGKIEEVELRATYFDVFLSEIIADQDRRSCLRSSNKSVNENITHMRPDVIISTLVQHEFGYSVGFGETRNGNASKQAVNLDVFRPGIASRNVIDQNLLFDVLSAHIVGNPIIDHYAQFLLDRMVTRFLDLVASPKKLSAQTFWNVQLLLILPFILFNQLFLSINDIVELAWLERECTATEQSKWDGVLFKIHEKYVSVALVEFSGGSNNKTSTIKERSA